MKGNPAHGAPSLIMIWLLRKLVNGMGTDVLRALPVNDMLPTGRRAPSAMDLQIGDDMGTPSGLGSLP
jgi:hypothetical protein